MEFYNVLFNTKAQYNLMYVSKYQSKPISGV